MIGPEIIEADTAAKFLKALDITQDRWGYNHSRSLQWLFRGQRNADWNLVPSAFRKGSALASPVEELRRVQDFASLAAEHSLDVPGDGPVYRDEPITSEELKPGTWPPSRLFPAIAIAQHHGIPTRLLDWSHRPRIAAYFAARDCVMTPSSGKDAHESKLAVWAFALHLMDPNLGPTGPLAAHQLVTAPYASNPNLAAQRGAFTLDRTQTAASAQPFEKVLLTREKRHWKEEGLRRPVKLTRKITLPQSEASHALQLLREDGISAASIYPGFDGVACLINQERPRYPNAADVLARLKRAPGKKIAR